MSTFNSLFDPAIFDPAVFDSSNRFPSRTYCFSNSAQKRKLKDLSPDQVVAIKEYFISRVQTETQ